MDEKRLVKVSKYLSKHLRHTPEALGLKLDSAGWTGVNELLEACRKHHFMISRDELQQVVDQNSKKRFAFSENGQKIRANQGHSIEVELGYEVIQPPAFLFHGTAEFNNQKIMADGLKKMNRHHVHLSGDLETALSVGRRHGKPIVYKIDTGKMAEDGFQFFKSDNNVWLTDNVPPGYLNLYNFS